MDRLWLTASSTGTHGRHRQPHRCVVANLCAIVNLWGWCTSGFCHPLWLCSCLVSAWMHHLPVDVYELLVSRASVWRGVVGPYGLSCVAPCVLHLWLDHLVYVLALICVAVHRCCFASLRAAIGICVYLCLALPRHGLRGSAGHLSDWGGHHLRPVCWSPNPGFDVASGPPVC